MTDTKQLSRFSKLAAAGTLAAAVASVAAPASAGSWVHNTGANQIGGMDVWVYTPDSVSPVGNGRSAMIVMHGCAQTAADMKTGANLEVVADAYGMVMAVPDVADGGVGTYSCWDYYGSSQSRTTKHNDNLIGLGAHLRNRADVDQEQVYIAGLSSGATQAQVTGCLAPDIFAGVGSSGGPTMGTSSNQAFTFPAGSASTAASLCTGWAGSNSGLLSTQMWNIAHGTSDGFVPYGYAGQNMDAVAIFKNVSKNAGSNSPAGATETTWGAMEATHLAYNGMDHDWAAGGSTGGGTYIDHSTSRVNYAEYLADYFMSNNQRYDRNQGPVINSLSLSASADIISVVANITDAEGSVTSATAVVTDAMTGAPVATLTLIASGGDVFTADSASLVDGLYNVEVTGTDNEGAAGDSDSDTVRVGPEPAAAAPVLSNITATTSGVQCATVAGTAVDINQNLDTVVVAFSTGTVAATMTGNDYSATACGIPGGNNSATVTATDTGGLSSTDSVSFDIDAGVTGDYNLHINEGHITWGDGYSACYLEFGTDAFTMREVPAGSDCEWVADGASACNGPVQACTQPPQPTDTDGDGVADATDNCPNDANTNQLDNDNDGQGNVCDATPDGPVVTDTDGDGVADSADNCPNDANANQLDSDSDGTGDVCDATPNGPDSDGDGVADADDNCPNIANADQADDNNNGIGNVCEPVVEDCEQVTAANYYHKTGGRAYSSGSYWTPNYYANGSNDAMAGSTWGTTTLKSTDGGTVWNVGTCP